MNRPIKIVFLIIMLAIPASIFMFLRFFGDNQFDVEVLYQDGVEADVRSCGALKGEYNIADSIFTKSNTQKVILFTNGNDLLEISNISNRIFELFDNNVEVICYSATTTTSDADSFIIKNVNDLDYLADCVFIVDNKQQIILVDNKNRIRGYYMRELDEVDRLIVELKIIIENDQRHAD